MEQDASPSTGVQRSGLLKKTATLTVNDQWVDFTQLKDHIIVLHQTSIEVFDAKKPFKRLREEFMLEELSNSNNQAFRAVVGDSDSQRQSLFILSGPCAIWKINLEQNNSVKFIDLSSRIPKIVDCKMSLTAGRLLLVLGAESSDEAIKALWSLSVYDVNVNVNGGGEPIEVVKSLPEFVKYVLHAVETPRKTIIVSFLSTKSIGELVEMKWNGDVVKRYRTDTLLDCVALRSIDDRILVASRHFNGENIYDIRLMLLNERSDVIECLLNEIRSKPPVNIKASYNRENAMLVCCTEGQQIDVYPWNSVDRAASVDPARADSGRASYR